MKPAEERLTDLEVSVGIIRHDVANMRMINTGLDIKVDKLQGTIFRTGIAIVASIILLLLSIIGYFVKQKDMQIAVGRATDQRAIEYSIHKDAPP